MYRYLNESCFDPECNLTLAFFTLLKMLQALKEQLCHLRNSVLAYIEYSERRFGTSGFHFDWDCQPRLDYTYANLKRNWCFARFVDFEALSAPLAQAFATHQLAETRFSHRLFT